MGKLVSSKGIKLFAMAFANTNTNTNTHSDMNLNNALVTDFIGSNLVRLLLARGKLESFRAVN
ncbi:MAG: hypothetical protein NT030_07070 [Candidatus Saganbacteria bacterium]|nr:hypothetical protein [Candidatus Saganbacteria bacterium]